jgi:hypothetical protein
MHFTSFSKPHVLFKKLIFTEVLRDFDSLQMYPPFADCPQKDLRSCNGVLGGDRRRFRWNSDEAGSRGQAGAGAGWPEGLLGLVWGCGRGGGVASEGAWRQRCSRTGGERGCPFIADARAGIIASRLSDRRVKAWGTATLGVRARRGNRRHHGECAHAAWHAPAEAASWRCVRADARRAHARAPTTGHGTAAHSGDAAATRGRTRARDVASWRASARSVPSATIARHHSQEIVYKHQNP